jgi:hypothetical protein
MSLERKNDAAGSMDSIPEVELKVNIRERKVSGVSTYIMNLNPIR